jgi:hypothetical protein
MSDVIADLAVQLSINDVDDSAITNLQAAIDSMADKTVNIATDVDTAPITDAESTINSLQDSTLNVITDVDTSALDAAKTTIDDIATSPIDVTTDVDTSALDNVSSEISSLDGQTISVGVDASGMTALRTELAASKAELNDLKGVSKTSLGTGGGLATDALDATAGTKDLKMGMMDAKKETSSLRTAITSLTGSGSGLSRELVAPLKSAGSMAGVAAVQSTMLGQVLGGLGPLAIPVAAGIAAVGAGIVSAALFSGTFRDTLGQIVPIVQTLGGHLSDAFSDLTKGNITGAISDIKTGFEGAYNSLRAMDWGGILSKIGTETLAGIKNAVTEAISFLSAVDWGAIGTSIVNGLRTVGTDLKNIFQDAYNYLAAVDWGAVWDTIVSGASKIGDALKNIWNEGLANLKAEDWGGAWNSITSGASGIGNGIVNAIKSVDWGGAFASLTSWFSSNSMGNGISGGIMNSIKNIDWGGIGTGIYNAIKSVDWGGAFSTLVNAMPQALTAIGGAIVRWAQSIDWHGVGETAGNLLGQALVAGVEAAFNLADIIAQAIGGGFQGVGASGGGGGAAATAGKSLGDQFNEGFTSAMSGFGDAIQTQLSRITIDWSGLFAQLNTAFTDLAVLLGQDIFNAFATLLSGVSFMGIHFDLPKVDTTASRNQVQSDFSKMSLTSFLTVTPDMSKMEPAISASLGGVHNVMATLANSGELHASAASAVIGPHPTTASLANGGAIMIQTAASIIGPHPTNANLANGGTVNAQTAASIVGPHATNANLANGGTVTAQTASAIIGPHAANATVTNVNASALQNMAGTAHADITSFQNLLGTISLPATAYITAVTGTLSALLRGEGGIVKASEGFVTRGPQLVLAGDNPGGQEAFVPLRHGKIPIEGGTGGGTVNHYHLNLSGLITEPITEETLITLFKRMEQMQGAAYQ